MLTKPLHITIGVAMRGAANLSHDLRLVKAAILYGDHATLCSLSSAMLLGVVAFTEIGMEERLNFLVSLAPAANLDPVAIQQMVQTYRELKRRKRRTREELVACLQLEGVLAKTFDEMHETIYAMAEEAGLAEIVAAVNSGLLTLHPFRHLDDTDALIGEFFTAVTDSISDLGTYPLFDDQVGELVRAGIQEGLVDAGDAGRERARVVGLAAGLVEQLPLFDSATLDEVIEIRRELDEPLVRFRSAVIDVAGSIERVAWDKDFPHDVDTVLRRDIEPAVLEIREAVQANKYLGRLADVVVRRPLQVGTATALGMLVSSVDSASHQASTALGIAAGAGVAAVEAYKEWKERQREIEANRLYFYYKAGNLVGRSAR